MSLVDQKNSYGWISITLHWLAAIVIFSLWFLGDSSQSDSKLQAASALKLHITIAIGAYMLLLLRIVWRLKSGHPWLNQQSKSAHVISSIAHYTMLLTLLIMLITGPLLTWSNGINLAFFDWFVISSPIKPSIELAKNIHDIHKVAGNTLIIIALIHLCGACKHLMFNNDETFIRMLIPKVK